MRSKLNIQIVSNGQILTLIFMSVFWVNSAYSQRVPVPTEHVFNLRYQPCGFSLSIPVDSWEQDKKFEKEPEFGKRTVARGLIPTGIEKKNHIGFAWDRDEGKLYLDLNRNRDITDDLNGLFLSDNKGRYQRFENIHLKAEIDSVQLEFVAEMTIYDFRHGRPHYQLCVRSGFMTQIELYGKKWLLKLVDNLDGKITESDRIVLIPIKSDVGLEHQELSLPVPEEVFFDGHNYNVSFEFRTGEKDSSIQARFREIDSSLGELKLEGKFIRRLVLESGHSLVLLDLPKPSVSIPTGKYHLQDLLLEIDEAEIFRAEKFTARTGEISISETEPAILKIGGPLEGTVEVNRIGNVLEMNYHLVGGGGHGYRSLQGRPDNPPTFAIYKDGQKIASGKFEYG